MAVLHHRPRRVEKIMAQQARDAGLTVTEHVGGTGVVALLKNGAGPIVMIRTELDALPVEEDTGLFVALLKNIGMTDTSAP
jgi:hippurate hydrolase